LRPSGPFRYTGPGPLHVAGDHQKVGRVAREAVNGRGNHHVAGDEAGHQLFELRPVGGRAGDLLAENPFASGRPVRRRDSGQDEDALIGCALHQHKLHLSEVYGLRRDQAGRILLKNDGLVFHETE